MSELTTIARPYAKAAFDFAVESQAVASWNDMLNFAGEVAKNNDIVAFLAGSHSPEVTSDLFIKVCGEQLNEKGQNFIKVLAENGRLVALPAVAVLFEELKAQYENRVSISFHLSPENDPFFCCKFATYCAVLSLSSLSSSPNSARIWTALSV